MARKSAAVVVPNGSCQLSREEFNSSASPLAVTIGGQSGPLAEPRTFSTGSFGWFFSGKSIVMVNGKPVKVQLSGNVVVVGSKES